MRVPAYVPVIGEVFAVMTYLLASMGTLPLDLYPQGVPVKEALQVHEGIP